MIKQHFAVRYEIDLRQPTDGQRYAHASAKRRLFLDIAGSIQPGRSYAIRYDQQALPGEIEWLTTYRLEITIRDME